jgi:methyl-accepting chemotaxis protein
MATNQQNQRSIFLINKPFQLRLSFYVCSWLFALSVVYPIIIYNMFDYFRRYLQLDPNGPSLASIQSVRQEVVYLLAMFQTIFLIITFLISIFVSHRIAGPLYKMKMFFRQNGGGKLSPKLQFRKGDYFQEMAQEYNEMLAKMRGDLTSVHALVTDAANELDSLSASGASGSSGNPAQLQTIIASLHRAADQIPR